MVYKMLNRILNLPNLLKKKSFFLFGPRATGKSSLVAAQFNEQTPVLDLLDNELYLRLTSEPWQLESIIKGYPQHERVVLDEIQRVPALLDEVHRLIEKEKIRFLLTGSSARKLKRQHANLLAGRAWQAELFGLSYAEIPEFNLQRYLTYGGLPVVYLSEDPKEELLAYANTYLKEEIQAEAVVRQLPAFTRFLHFSALTSGNLLNFSNIANDAGVPASTVREYYHVLEDTFIGFMLPAWTKSVKRKPISTAKFYYFDLGVKNIIARIDHLDPQSDLFGQAFEHFIALELRAYISYRRKHLNLSYWQAVNGQEVDFVIEDHTAIEVKTTSRVQDKHLKGLRALIEEKICHQYYLISQDPLRRKIDNINIIFWRDFLNALWDDKILLS
ncbi:ATP-binding protein [Coxiella burnetii]|uniref:ATP-binding protein n=1 Tax=Coxiella burnetii TaxID=777 RepID=UPI0009B64C17|nr:ATP-binding protein [Coxiella burnetii]PHH57190.1 ATPase [Coxiella burnetii]